MVWSGTCQHSCSSGAWITPCLCPSLLKWGNLRSDLGCKSVYYFWCLCKEKVSKVMWRYMAPYLAPQSSGWQEMGSRDFHMVTQEFLVRLWTAIILLTSFPHQVHHGFLQGSTAGTGLGTLWKKFSSVIWGLGITHIQCMDVREGIHSFLWIKVL